MVATKWLSKVAVDLLNDRVLPLFEEQNVPLLRVLTDRGTEYCGNRESHEYQLYLAGGPFEAYPVRGPQFVDDAVQK